MITTNNAHGFPPLGPRRHAADLPAGLDLQGRHHRGGRRRTPGPAGTRSYPRSTTTPACPTPTRRSRTSASAAAAARSPQMLPPSCDTGYALLGPRPRRQPAVASTADAFGFNTVPPLDLPGVVPSYFPSASSFQYNLPGLAYSAIGQQNVRETALQNALVAAAIANGGVMMTPHLLDYITAPDGTIVKRLRTRRSGSTPLTPAQDLPDRAPDAERRRSTARRPASSRPPDDVAAKTGTAQIGNARQEHDDWMIAFAPASAPDDRRRRGHALPADLDRRRRRSPDRSSSASSRVRWPCSRVSAPPGRRPRVPT